jgi:hypothetical protein
MEIRTEIEIEAAPADVFRVLTDFKRYPEWNPFIVSIAGKLEPGAYLSITTSAPESHRERTFHARLSRCEPARELRWLGHRVMKGLLDSEHFLLLEPSGNGSTRLVNGQNTTGLLLKLALHGVTLETRGLVYMNQALKRRVETSAEPKPVEARS